MLTALYNLIGLVTVVTVVLVARDVPLPSNLSRGQKTFLTAWYLCVFGDWLQGPLVFRMAFTHLGEDGLVNQLVLTGYLSGMVGPGGSSVRLI